MKTLNNAKYERLFADILKRISQIVSDSGFGKITILIKDNEIQMVEHTVTKVFKSISQ